jgi:hypothetical protein
MILPPRLQNDIERSLGRAPEARESAFVDNHFAQPLLASLSTKRGPAFR